LTAQPHAHVRFRRAIERRALWLAEDAARELPNLPLEDALQRVLVVKQLLSAVSVNCQSRRR
jgi:hypothetical protein